MILAAMGLLACDEPVSVSSDAASTDVTSDSDGSLADVADALDDGAAPDTLEDTAAPDTPGDRPEPDSTPDLGPEIEPDTDFDLPEIDADAIDTGDRGIDCGEDMEICEDPYVCIDGACQIALGESTWAESDFDITEPEELTRIFELFKAFATDVKFMVLDFGVLSGSVDALYGTADLIDESVSPVQVSWQDLAETHTLGFVPFRDESAPLAGDSWVSEEFLYELRASATIEFPGLDPIVADFGLDALQVTIQLWLDPLVPDHMSGRLTGLVTRVETESRDLGTREAFDGFDALFCDVAGYDPGPEWQLSDVLDCNEAVLDADADGDGTLDAYRVVIDAQFEVADLLP